MNWLRGFKLQPQISKLDIVLTVVPVVIWVGLVFSRPALIDPYCVQTGACTAAKVVSIDRAAINLHSAQADSFSYITQNSSGAFLVAVPLAWQIGLAVLGKVSVPSALAFALTDFVIGLETAVWNGALGETVRVIVQRPRPFVFANPEKDGPNPAHYVSFYSGHTSFAAAATAALFFILLSRGASLLPLTIWGAVAMGLTASTAVFRVLAGRHFLTDVFFGALAGWTVAWVIAKMHRPNSGP